MVGTIIVRVGLHGWYYIITVGLYVWYYIVRVGLHGWYYIITVDLYVWYYIVTKFERSRGRRCFGAQSENRVLVL